VLRFIAEGFNRNLTAMDIKDGLSCMVAKNIEFEEVTATTIAATTRKRTKTIHCATSNCTRANGYNHANHR